MTSDPTRSVFAKRYQRFAWLTLALNLAVILWGAYVRATGSGDGCGGSWPLCDGDVIPLSRSAETLIEYTHRISSGIVLLMTLGITFFARQFQPGRRVRKAALASGLFIIIEALLGAGLVLFDLVGGNTSAIRAAASAVHLSNTYLLLGAITLTAVWSNTDRGLFNPIGKGGWIRFGIAFLALMIVGASGAITALGDTLFPAENLAVGIADELGTSAHFLVRLRILHPLIAFVAGAYLLIGLRFRWFGGRGEDAGVLVNILIGLVLLQWAAGAVNVLLLAPIWMQLLHLFIADSIWVAFVLYTERQLITSSYTPQSN